MNKDKMVEWIATHHTGLSSIAMWSALMVRKRARIWFGIPYDADDFSRCYDLVNFCEISTDEDFPKIIQVLPWYAPILHKWSDIAKMYEKGDYESVSDILYSLRAECYALHRVYD